MATILIVDDEVTFARNAAKYLERFGHTVSTAATVAEGKALAETQKPEALVLDYRLPDGTGLEFIEHIRATDPSVYIILITGHGTIELAVDAMKAGANDLLTKPVSLLELRERIDVLMQQQRDASRLRYFEARERSASQSILGQSPAIRELQQRIERMASIDAEGMLPPILIGGETGTGKELVARACHYLSPRSAKPFIEINCAAMPPTLLETELFGHERGAFTDAKERKIGLLEAADGGTLFLDEVGDMDLSLQAKLLKVIEDGRFRRIGSVQEHQVCVRIVAATNHDLEARVAEGVFRADLYFRLRVLQLMVPPLRDREDDAVFLARHFFNLMTHKLNDTYKLICAKMRLLLVKDLRGSSCLHKSGKNFLSSSKSIFYQSIQLSIGKSPCTALSELYIGLRVKDAVFPEIFHGFLAFVCFFSPFQYQWTVPGFGQVPGTE